MYNRKSSADTEVNGEGWGGGVPGSGEGIPLRNGEDHGEEGCPLWHLEVNGGADMYLQPVERTLGQVNVTLRDCGSVGSLY